MTAKYDRLYHLLKASEENFNDSLKRQFGKQWRANRHAVHKFDAQTKKHAKEFASAFDAMVKLRQSNAKKQRKQNPARKSKKQQIKKAAILFEDFTGHKASAGTTVIVPDYPDTLTVIGPCVAIAYECVRDGEKAQYQHEFSNAAAPLLCASPDGSQLFLVGGAYEFRDTGINDDA